MVGMAFTASDIIVLGLRVNSKGATPVAFRPWKPPRVVRTEMWVGPIEGFLEWLEWGKATVVCRAIPRQAERGEPIGTVTIEAIPRQGVALR